MFEIFNINKARYSLFFWNRFMETPSTHMKIARRILRDLKGTLDFGLFYSPFGNFKFVGFSDSVFVGDDDRKSIAGFVFLVDDCAISRSSKKKPIITLST